MTPLNIGSHVIAIGRYVGWVRESIRVQDEHGYSYAYRVQYQREIDPCQGWFLGRDVEVTRQVAESYSEQPPTFSELCHIGGSNAFKVE